MKTGYRLGTGMVCIGLLLQGLGAPLQAQNADAAMPLNVVVIPGDRADKRDVTEEFRVRVDLGGQPVSGALVYLHAPNDGPGGSFLDDLKSLQVITNDVGMAFAPGFRPNRTAGAYDIRVIAMYQGQMGYAVIHEANEPARVAGLSHKGWWIAAGVVAGVAAGGGTYLALHHSGSPSSTISAGGVTVGTPH